MMKIWPFHNHIFIEEQRVRLYEHNDRHHMGYLEKIPSSLTFVHERCTDKQCRKWRTGMMWNP